MKMKCVLTRWYHVEMHYTWLGIWEMLSKCLLNTYPVPSALHLAFITTAIYRRGAV